MLSIKRLQEIGEDLLGSCRSILDYDDIEDDLKVESYLEEQGIINCHCCGWWVDEHDELHGEQLCFQCIEDEEHV